MDITWGDIGDVLRKSAPIVANILTGGTAGAITTVAGLIASELGCEPTPTAIQATLQASPEAMQRVMEMENNHRRDMAALSIQARGNELAADTARMTEVNATMRAESQSDKWWVSGWRPFWGFISGGAFGYVVYLCCNLANQAVTGGKPEALTMIPQLVSSMALLFGIPGGILGVASWHRGKEKRIRAGEPSSGGLLSGLVGARRG